MAVAKAEKPGKELLATVQVRDDESQDEDGDRWDGKKWSYSGFILKVDSREYANIPDMESETKIRE